MINPSELRIGNWVGFPAEGGYNNLPIEEGSEIDAAEYYEPIPLDKNSLSEIFGFTWQGGDHYENHSREVWIEDRASRGGYQIIRPFFCPTIVKTVHHLQNLYFDLNGKELPLSKGIELGKT